MMWKESSASSAIAVSALLAFNLFVVGPSTVHSGNVGEFSASFSSILGHLAAGVLLLTLALAAILLLVPRRFRGRPVVFVFSLAALAWLQGNWLLGNFGLLDGGRLDLEAGAPARIGEAALWIGGIAAAQLFYRTLFRHVVALAGVFLALQAAVLPLAAWTAGRKGFDGKESLAIIADDEIYSFSSGTNIVLLILDSLTADTFVRFADRRVDHYDRMFSGFVVYTDVTGAFPTTQYSLPAMLGAPPYDNRTPVDDYMIESLQRDSINGRLLDRGYAVDWVSAWPLFCLQGTYSTCYAIPRPYAPPPEVRRQMAAELIDISLFRHAPYDRGSGVRHECRRFLQGLHRGHPGRSREADVQDRPHGGRARALRPGLQLRGRALSSLQLVELRTTGALRPEADREVPTAAAGPRCL
jgi:hypothetical protein